MALGLKRLIGAVPGWRRRSALAVLVCAVVIVHGCVTRAVADRMASIAADQDMSARIEVAYVRELALSEPPPVAAPAAPPPAAAPVARHRPPKPPKAASAPEPQPEPGDPVVAAASASEPAPEPPAASAASESADGLAVEVPNPPATETASAASAPASTPTAVGAVASASVPASGPANGFEWPASTRVSYVLTGNYRGDVNGSAQVEWVRMGSRYQVHLDLVVGPSAAPIITRRMTSDGEITAEGLVPQRYDQDTKVVLRERHRATITFEPGSVVLANGQRRDSVPGVQDTASQFVQLTYVFSTRPELLRIGGSVDIPLALPHKVDVWTYDVVEEETLYTPFGPLQSIHLKPRRTVEKAGSLSAEMWFAPQLRYLPVRIRIEQDPQTYIDLLISKLPEMER